MTNALTKTTVREIVQFISSETTGSVRDVASFFFGDYEKSQYFPRNEELCGAMRNEVWDTEVGIFLVENKTIPVSLKNFGREAREEHGIAAMVIGFSSQVEFRKLTRYAAKTGSCIFF